MNFEERLAQSQAKLEELKEKINKSIDSAKDAYQVDKKEAMIKLAKMNAAIEDFGRDVEAQVYCDVTSMQNEVKADTEAINKAMEDINDKIDAKIADSARKYDDAAEKFMAKVDDSLATAEGSVYAAEENSRLAKERYNSKLNATRLKVQMHQEEVIMDLLDYADDCQMIAYSYAMEAELATMDACDEIADYEAKYGKFEEA